MDVKFEKKFGRNLLIALFCAFVAYLLLKETDRVRAVWNGVMDVLSPFLSGAVIAFALNVPMRAIERRLSFIKHEKVQRVTAILLTLLTVAALIAVVILLLVPQVERTVKIFATQLPPFFQKINDLLMELLEKYPQLWDILGLEENAYGIDWMKLVETVMEALETSISALVGSAVSMVSGIVNAVYNGVFCVIFSFYCLAQKETLARQGRKMLYALVKENRADEIVRVLRMTNTTFSNFITGQCLDAVILGIMCAITMFFLKMPYIPLICVIIVITALVPVMGALIGCAIGAFLIFVTSPLQALIFIIMFIVIQQIDNNIVYPRVVGSSIGLPGMWVLVAVLVGQSLMGVIGMLLMVPLASVLYVLLREFAQKRVTQRQVAAEKLQCQPPELQPHFMFRKGAQAKQKLKERKERKKADKNMNK